MKMSFISLRPDPEIFSSVLALLPRKSFKIRKVLSRNCFGLTDKTCLIELKRSFPKACFLTLRVSETLDSSKQVG